MSARERALLAALWVGRCIDCGWTGTGPFDPVLLRAGLHGGQHGHQTTIGRTGK